jgi:hypothetical protein
LLRPFAFVEFNRRGRIRIDDSLILTERGELRDQFAGSIHREGIAIEHQLIVAADEIAITDWALMRSRKPRHHLVTNRRFMQAKRRRA